MFINLMWIHTSKIISCLPSGTALDMIVTNGQQSAVMQKPFNWQNPA